ncbi:MAG: site-specific DNA-methyltransferase [Dehalococcoidia bacterium]|nr:site-specific DNA-methyltransferase [Dehalococcoidia bacterium]
MEPLSNGTLHLSDNLPILRSMPDESVHLIATDPPFNTGRHVSTQSGRPAADAEFSDQWSWERDVDADWLAHLRSYCPTAMRVVETSRETAGESMATYLCFMAVRLVEMRRALNNDGSIYLHCDPTSSHYVKQLMDAVFGMDNFRNEIIWSYGLGGSSPKRYSRKHDVILFYTKSDRYMFNKPQTPAKSQKLKGQMKGATDVWDIPSLNNMAKERTGFPTQKPLALYERIIEASSNPGDLVLDPFCGSGTTLVAAERLNRHWIGIDTNPTAIETARERLGADGVKAP